MPPAFIVTTETNTVPLDGKRTGSCTLTVSNVMDRAVRASLDLRPLGDAKADWVQIDGDAHRDLASSGSDQVKLQVAVPLDVAPGNYVFSLHVVADDKPEEDFAQSPELTIKVPVVDRPRKHFPWWVVAVAAAVVVLCAAVVYVVSRGGPAAPVITSLRVTAPDLGQTGPPILAATGTGFGSSPPSGATDPPQACDLGGLDYSGNALYLEDEKTGITYGQSTSCLGLIISSWSPTELDLTFSSSYGSTTPGPNPLSTTISEGDPIKLVLRGASFSGVADYPRPCLPFRLCIRPLPLPRPKGAKQ